RRDDVSGVPQEAPRDDGDQIVMMIPKTSRVRFTVVFAIVSAACLAVAGLQAGGGGQQQNFDAVQVNILKAQGNVYMLVGAGGNVTMQIGSEGVLMVDTQFAPMS